MESQKNEPEIVKDIGNNVHSLAVALAVNKDSTQQPTFAIAPLHEWGWRYQTLADGKEPVQVFDIPTFQNNRDMDLESMELDADDLNRIDKFLVMLEEQKNAHKIGNDSDEIPAYCLAEEMIDQTKWPQIKLIIGWSERQNQGIVMLNLKFARKPTVIGREKIEWHEQTPKIIDIINTSDNPIKTICELFSGGSTQGYDELVSKYGLPLSFDKIYAFDDNILQTQNTSSRGFRLPFRPSNAEKGRIFTVGEIADF